MKKNAFQDYLPFLFLAVVAIIGVFIPALPGFSDTGKYSAADIGWILVASSLVFLMTPGLSFFYGGMVNRKNVISTMMQSFIATGLISVVWVVVGFSLAFGTSFHGIIGNPTTFFMFQQVGSGAPWSLAPTIPLLLFALFQMKFAIITPALVVGAVAERIRFTSYVLFMVLFSILVYAPIAHWTWHPDGILFKLGVLDFAGGTVVHISAGCAALAGALVLKRRKDHIEKKELQPANIPFVLLGTGLLWFGWFGFNAGSALGANALAATAFATTNTATAAAGLSWVFFDVVRGRKPSALGFCIGAVVGLVAITPAAGYVAIPQSIFIGFIAAIVSNLAVHWKSKTSIDDTLDVFPCHGLGGMVGMLLTGIFATKAVNEAGNNGWFYGNFELFKNQVLGLLLVVGYSFSVSYGIFKLINLIHPLRVSEDEESLGLDLTQHNENYHPALLSVADNGALKEEDELVH
ncbi:ammonium transporter [Chitinophaga nivalis]|uniref:Ammonium transporter n=1 Tax=Chitinophaga nivalis TaxID=2991709 RepID=A0ABT3IUM7_9BACT|nr:ammonium transporter [Chitinophaga nivalis]MCW3462626.1 ammonium transporter [Chitinophaga nivalis]MCW3487683.1 ammonium transporter [Chitinophaga nivalis]